MSKSSGALQNISDFASTHPLQPVCLRPCVVSSLSDEEYEGALQLYCYLLHMLLFAANEFAANKEGAVAASSAKQAQPRACFLPPKYRRNFSNLSGRRTLPCHVRKAGRVMLHIAPTDEHCSELVTRLIFVTS